MFKLTDLLLCTSFVLGDTVKGIDVSGYQPNANWNAVMASGIGFVYLKVTEG
jgi:GH25 family lysozyme M1 (1,4-beta-N-acetylmuramidase)